MKVSLNQQIDELDRELKVRSGLRKWGSFSEAQCEFLTARMQAARRSLDWLRRNEGLIRERCPELFEKGAAR